MSEQFSQDDRIATIAACSVMGLAQTQRGLFEPLGPDGWSKIAQWLHDRQLKPGALLDQAVIGQVTSDQQIAKLAARLTDLPERAALVALELERYESRGVWSLVRFDPGYPQRWRDKLKSLAPPVLFGTGPVELLSKTPSLAVVGSRDIDQHLAEIAASIGEVASDAGYLIVSGGARGSDRWGMFGALRHGRNAVGILHGDLAKDANKQDVRQYIEDGHLCLAAHVHPATGFVTGNAMARNRYIHALADVTIVIATARESGGTWSGSIDNLRRGWSPLLVWTGPGAPGGNAALVAEGGLPFERVPERGGQLETLLTDAARQASQPAQPSLF